MDDIHQASYSGHPRYQKTIATARKQYFWPGLKKDMDEYISRCIKKDMFAVGDLVLRWDARKEEKGKHGKFDNLWIGPFSVIKIPGNNTLF